MKVKAITGKPSTDEALVFVEKRNILFVGLPGKSNLRPEYLAAPKGDFVLPKQYHVRYETLMTAMQKYLESGSASDLKEYQVAQDEIREHSKSDFALSTKVLKGAADHKERLVAANARGQHYRSERQVSAR